MICSYLGKEFVRVGYYVNNDYTDPELRENPPEIPQFDKVCYLVELLLLLRIKEYGAIVACFCSSVIKLTRASFEPKYCS